MKRRKVLSMVAILMVLILSVAACSKSGVRYDSSTDNSAAYDMAGGSNESAQVAPEQAAQEGDYAVDTGEAGKDKDGSGLSFTTTSGTNAPAVQSQDKIIRTFFMDVETQEFDSLVTRIDSEIKRLEGYVEKSEVSGKRYYYNDEARYGRIEARIPRDKVDDFVSTVGENANIVSKQESTDNVSLQYIDTESRIETLEIEQERLYAILDKELSLENILTLENRLSDIRYELQNYQSQLRYYDNKVAYSTVTLSIQEVEKLTPVTEEKQTVGSRIKNGFSNTMYKINEGLKDFFVWFVINLPYLLIWGFIIAVIVIIVRRYMKKEQKKKLPDQNQNNTDPRE